MRKRLIERITHAKRGSLGYTLMEMLAVIGIIAIVCAIAIPSIFAIRDALLFAQANNYAKSIFLAAQQNLTEMRSDGGLGPVQSASGAFPVPNQVTSFPDEFRSEYVYTTTGTEAFSRVLPAGSIDGDLRKDQIVIEYNPITGNVYSVFYYDKSDLNLADQYAGGGLPREKDARKSMMLGYYDGSGLNSSQIDLEQIQAYVEFLNGEEGIVRVLVPMPESYFGEFDDFATGLNVVLSITGEAEVAHPAAPGKTAPDPLTFTIKTAGSMTGCSLHSDGRTVIMEYCIDSLADRSSFANYASKTQASAPGVASSGASLTTLSSENVFTYGVLPGENITIQAEVTYDGANEDLVQIAPGILSGVNPMFEYMMPSGNGRYVLAVSNGRNMQNLNALSPSIAALIDSVQFIGDINWNDTVTYYNNKYGTVSGSSKLYTNAPEEAPARGLPYFVPIHSEALFGTAEFVYNIPSWVTSIPEGPIRDIFEAIFSSNSKVPTLTDEFDNGQHAKIQGIDLEHNDGTQIYYLNIDSTKHPVRKAFYAGTAGQKDDRFTGLFSYVNTAIDGIHIVNPIVKGYYFTSGNTNNPATGALVGCAGYNTYISNCSVYLDTKDPNYSYTKMMGQTNYSKDTTQNWYGVSGQGAVGGLVGYAKSHRTTSGALDPNKADDVLAFYNSFAAVNVSGDLRPTYSKWLSGLLNPKYYSGYDKDYGYSTGIGGLVGNSELTNFYNCYASGNVMANNVNVADTYESNSSFLNFLKKLAGWFGVSIEFRYNGRESAGAGGFVGTSHGTRYTNCFATGEVTAKNTSEHNNTLGAGAFVGVMCIEETFAYGNQNDSKVDSTTIAQHTVFTNCYSAGLVSVNGDMNETFSGGSCRIRVNPESFAAAQVADYYRLLAPHYVRGSDLGANAQANTLPSYEDFYVYKDSYYLSNYLVQNAQNSNDCASPIDYATLQNLPGSHQSNDWISVQVENIKKIKLVDHIFFEDPTYKSAYFDVNKNLEGAYYTAYKQGFSSGWESATTNTTHSYDLNGVYPFSKIAGLDYYGDWPSKPLSMGVAYYEVYENSTNGYTHFFHFDRESTSELSSANSAVVLKDGYAVLSAAKTKITIKVNGISRTILTPDTSYKPGSQTYHAYILSDEQMIAAQEYVRTTGEFYVPITVTQDGSTHIFYFNPCAAKTQVNPAAMDGIVNSVKPDAAPATIIVRSARHFAALGDMPAILTADRQFLQQLNLDADTYLWPEDPSGHISGDKVVTIGSSTNPFNASYTGLYIDTETLEERQFRISGFKTSGTGFFGAIGASGSVSDLIIDCTDAAAGAADADNAALFAGVNSGLIDNVDMNLSGNVTVSAAANTGLLAGLSSGTIRDCDVTIADNAVISMNALNAGGLVGCALGTADSKTVLSNSTISFGNGAALSVGLETDDAQTTGGFVGYASNLTADNVVCKQDTIRSDAEYTGGLAGYAEESAISGIVRDADGNNPVEVTASSISTTNAAGYAAGVLAGGRNTVVTAVDVSVASVTGNTAAGFLGIGENVDATGCDVVITGSVTGTEAAAGVAGTIGSQSVFQDVPVLLRGAAVSGRNAAGYAIELKGDAYIMGGSHVTMGNPGEDSSKTTISAAEGDAAGFILTTAGSIGDANVIGLGSISGVRAAGYALTVNGSIGGCHVSPALSADAKGYEGNANSNLQIQGSSAAAGFALQVSTDATVSNCYVLGRISSDGTVEIAAEEGVPAESEEAASESEAPAVQTIAAAYGFAGTNSGTIDRCMANVDITGGYAFVGVNDGLVTTSYGWYADVKPDGDEGPATVAAVVGSGKCFSSYFADLAPKSRSEQSCLVYDDNGSEQSMTSTMLQSVTLSGFRTGYNAYPYNNEIDPPVYLYPMLRDHYGDWITPPQYAYGVAYYEIYAENPENKKIHMVDLSGETQTEDKNIEFREDEFTNEGTIVETGYAMFYNTIVGEQEGVKLFSVELDGHTYDFYAIETVGEYTVPKILDKSSSAVVDTRFADAIKVNEAFGENETYQIRTAQQLANIGAVAANYNQTHDIETVDVTSAVIGSGCSYNGNGLTLTITGQTKTWLTEVAGTVQALNLKVNGAVTQSVFGRVSGSVSLNTVELGAIHEGGAFFGEITGTSGVSVESITTNGAAVLGSIFTTVDAPVTVTKGITVGDVSGQLFGAVRKDVTVGGIQAVNVSSSLITSLSGAMVTTGEIRLASISQPLVKEFTSGTLQGDAKDQKAIAFTGDSKAVLSGYLFSETVGGAVCNYSVAAKSLNAPLAKTMGGAMTNVSVSISVNAGAAFLETMDGDMSNVTFAVTGNASNALISTLNGTMTDSSISVGGDARGLIGTVSKNLDNVTLSVGKLLSGSAIGSTNSSTSLNNVTLTAASANAKGGVLVGSNGGSISDCSVNVGTVTGSGTSFGIVADRLDSDKTLSAEVMVDTLTFTPGAASSVGGLVGNNAGTISGSVVCARSEASGKSGMEQEAQTASASQSVTLTGAANSQITYGGLVGTNSGDISGSTARVDVTYVQPTDAATDAATIGGLVGTMSGGTLTGSGATDATGSIALASGTGEGKSFVIGGAIGKLTGGSVGNTHANVVVPPSWAKAAKVESDATFGSSGIVNNGPVGMFVGYAGAVTLENCSSTEPTNETYQFLGEAMVGDRFYSDGTWVGSAKADSVLSYSDSAYCTGNVYTAADGSGITVTGKGSADKYSGVCVELNGDPGCTFYLNGQLKHQTYGNDVSTYTMATFAQSAFKATQLTGTLNQVGVPQVKNVMDSNSTDGFVDSPYYIRINGQYYRLGVKVTSYWAIVRVRNYYFAWYTDNGTYEQIGYIEGTTPGYTRSLNDVNWTHKPEAYYTLTTPSLDSGKQYLVVSGGNAYGSNGNVTDGVITIPLATAFKQRDDMYNGIWNWQNNNGKHIWTTVAHGLQVEEANPVLQIPGKFTSPVVKYTINNVVCDLYIVNVDPAGAYNKVVFTYQPNGADIRQFITAK